MAASFAFPTPLAGSLVQAQFASQSPPAPVSDTLSARLYVEEKHVTGDGYGSLKRRLHLLKPSPLWTAHILTAEITMSEERDLFHTVKPATLHSDPF